MNILLPLYLFENIEGYYKITNQDGSWHLYCWEFSSTEEILLSLGPQS